MPKRKEPELDPKEQFERFKNAANDAKVDPQAAESAFRKMAGKIGFSADEILMSRSENPVGWIVARYDIEGQCHAQKFFALSDKQAAVRYAEEWQERLNSGYGAPPPLP